MMIEVVILSKLYQKQCYNVEEDIQINIDLSETAGILMSVSVHVLS